jgi:2-polyprenyl-3-methyl-5-hydroxy-6-metoxy-1,4-benzoquinol methylase
MSARAMLRAVLTRPIHRAGRWYIRRVCAVESATQVFRLHNERSIEYRFALEALATHRPQTVLDVGTGNTAWPHLLRTCGYVVTAIDNVRDYWPDGMVNRHWTVLDRNILAPTDLPTVDAITCISTLEHISEHARAMAQMATLLKPRGILIMTTPFAVASPHPNVYTHPDALYGQDLPYICRSSSAAELATWLADGRLVEERREFWRLCTGPVWATGTRCPWVRVADPGEPHQLGCFVFRRATA